MLMTQNLQIEGQKEVLYSSTAWSNGNKRTLTNHGEKDPDDSKVIVRAGTNRRFEIDGKGTAFLSGHQTRIYIASRDYNAAMQLTYTHNKSLDILSLRLRSLRSEEQDDVDYSKVFGGFGLLIHRDSIEANYQKSIDEGKVDIGEQSLKKKIPDDSPVTVRWWVRDRGEKIEVKAWIKYDKDGEFEEVFTASNKDYDAKARDKDEFHKSGAAYIRVNNETETPKDVPIKDVYIIELE